MKLIFTSAKVLCHISLGVLCLTMCMISGCNEDQPEPEPVELVIGTWTIETVSFEFFFDNKTLVQYLVEEYQISVAEAVIAVELLSASYSDFFTGTVTIKEDNTYALDFGDGVESGTWEISQDGKTITFDKGTIDETIAEIISLSAHSFVIEMTQNAEEDIDQDGMNENLIMLMHMSLVK